MSAQLRPRTPDQRSEVISELLETEPTYLWIEFVRYQLHVLDGLNICQSSAILAFSRPKGQPPHISQDSDGLEL